MRQGVGPIEGDAEYLDRFPGILEHSKFLEKKNNHNLYLYPCFTQNGSENYKTILFIGQTGTGKTSSINFFLNYYLGVQFEDNIRFQLINEQKQAGSQAVSQTQNVNIYYVKPMKEKEEGLRIIDTPGFADTNGIFSDQIILDKIQNCLKKDIKSIQAICFLIRATETRLTSTQQYVFSSIVQIFGKNIIRNLIFLFPFFDNDEKEVPNALQIVNFKGDEQAQNQKSCLADIFDQMSEPKYIKYNNTIMYSKNDKASNGEKWNYFMNQFNEFKTKKLVEMPLANLQQTVDVIFEREKFKKTIQQLKQIVPQSLNAINTMKEIHKAITQLDPQIQQVSNYTYPQTIYNTYTTQVLTGYKQRIVQTPQKKQAQKKPTSSLYSKTKPKTSVKKSVTKIYNDPIYEDVTTTSSYQQTVVDQNLKQQYDKLQADKIQKQTLLETTQNDYLLKLQQFNILQNDFLNCSRKLELIALNPLLINEHERQYIQQSLQVNKNYYERLNLSQMMGDIQITEEILNKNGNSQKTQVFYNQLLQAKKEGNLSRLLSQA